MLLTSFEDLAHRMLLVDKETRESAEWSLYVCIEQNQIFFVDELSQSTRLLQQLLSLRDKIHIFEAVYDISEDSFPAVAFPQDNHRTLLLNPQEYIDSVKSRK